jgi:hypothetical protein
MAAFSINPFIHPAFAENTYGLVSVQNIAPKKDRTRAISEVVVAGQELKVGDIRAKLCIQAIFVKEC